MEAITKGVFNSRPFTPNDTLALIISALNSSMEETQSITYYLAVDGQNNNGWTQVPLTALGQAAGLSFRMTTTDIGQFGENTPLYFALDGLTVNTDDTALPQISTPKTKPTKILLHQQIYILRDNERYTPLGQRIR